MAAYRVSKKAHTLIKAMFISTSVFSLLAGCAGTGEQRALTQSTATLEAQTQLLRKVDAGYSQASFGVSAQASASSAVVTTLAQAPLLKAQSLLVKGDFTRALAGFEEAQKTAELADLAQIGQAVALLGLGDTARSEQILAAQVARSASLTPKAKINLGFALAIAGQPTQAITILLPVVESVAANAQARQNIALAYALAGARTAAINWARVDLEGVSAVRSVALWEPWHQLSAAERVRHVFGLATSSMPTAAPKIQVEAPPVSQPLREVATQIALAPDNQPAQVAAASLGSETVTQAAETVKARAVESVAHSRAAPSVTGKNWVVQLAALPTQEHIQTRQDELERRHAGLLRKIGDFTTAPGPRGLTRLIIGQFDRYQDAAQACRMLQERNIPCFARLMPEASKPVESKTIALVAR
jgi:tetratricopeptide (TPR) repeat protein